MRHDRVREETLRRPRIRNPWLNILFETLRAESVPPDRRGPGSVILLPGVEGSGWQMASVIKGLHEGGVDHTLELLPWGDYPFGSLRNLRNFRENRRRARRIGARVAAYRRHRPNAPVSIIGYSGGGGIAVMVAEHLPPGVMLDRIVLLGAALSPTYDLSKALSRCRDGIVNFYSSRDWLMIGLGTRVFGTIDRRRSVSAGRTGFLDADGRLTRTAGLTQLGWSDAWRGLGHDGGHFGWLARRWARDVLAPEVNGAYVAAVARDGAKHVQARLWPAS